jgi:diguanylate cyclase (GGDEF)-like protein
VARERREVAASIDIREVTALAALLLFTAFIAFAFVVRPPVSQSPRNVDLVVGLCLATAAIVVFAGGRASKGLLVINGALGIGWLAMLLMTGTRESAPSQVVWGFPMVLAAAFAAYYLSTRAYAMHLVAMGLGYALAVVIAGPDVAGLFAVVAVATMVTSSLALRQLRISRDAAIATLNEIATTDPLTNTLNRRGLQQQAPGLHSSAARLGATTTVIALDLDHFKQYNDANGHASGDELLGHVTQQWRECLREGDLIARLGGDEFLLVLPNADTADADAMLSRMRERTAARWSAGYAVWGPSQDLWQAVAQADEALYRAKSERS